MALPVTMYRWDDEGAPQVASGKPSEYMNVLKKCLVDGYGAKPSLGWSVEEETASPPTLVLRNSASSGSGGNAFFVADNDNSGSPVTVFGCQDYVDTNNIYRKSSYFKFDRLGSGADLNKNWFIIGTARAFYFICTCPNSLTNNAGNGYSTPSFFVGDFNSLYPNDPATFISLSGQKNSSSTSYTSNLTGSISDGQVKNLTIIHPLDGSDSPSDASLVSLSSRFGCKSHIATPIITVLSPVYLAMGDGELFDSIGYQNNLKPFYRGLLPGVFLANSPGYRNEPMPVIKTIDSTEYYLIPSGRSYTGCLWINLEQW